MSLRAAGGVRWASDDSSTARKGPTSLPLMYSEELFKRLEDANSPWTDHAEDCCKEKHDEMIAVAESYAACRHEE